jgi:transposase
MGIAGIALCGSRCWSTRNDGNNEMVPKSWYPMGRKARRTMEKEQKRTAKAHFIAQIQIGQPWQVAAERARLHISRSTAYRLLRLHSSQGEVALQDGRHGHPTKLRGSVRIFLEEYCRQAPCTPSSVMQTLLQERFGVSVSISQINRVRAALGISNHRKSQQQEKKQREREALLLNQNGKKVLGVCC